MQRVVILGPGGSGKSTLAARIGEIAALPVIEMDKIFWQEPKRNSARPVDCYSAGIGSGGPVGNGW